MARRNRINFTLGSSDESRADSAVDSNVTATSGTANTDSGLPTEDGNSFNAIDPETSTAGNSPDNTNTNTRTRTRSRAGSDSGKSAARAANSAKRAERAQKATENLAATFHSLHIAAYMLFKSPEFCISPEEATRWADAVNRVNEQFDTSVISPKATALFNLAVVTGGIYAPRVLAYRNRKAKEKQQAKNSGNVVSVAGLPTEVKPN